MPDQWLLHRHIITFPRFLDRQLLFCRIISCLLLISVYLFISPFFNFNTFVRIIATLFKLQFLLKWCLLSWKSLCLFIVVEYNNDKVLSFVSRCGHLWYESRRFDCILLVFIIRKQDAPLWLVGFCVEIHILPVQWIDLRSTRRRSYGEPGFRCYC